MTANMVTEPTRGRTAVNTSASGQMENNTAKVSTDTQMDRSAKAAGKKASV